MKELTALVFLIILNFSLFAQVVFEVDASQKGKEISQELVGAFFEDINYGADGGLYAELVQNRSFEYYKVDGYVSLEPLTAWSLVKKGNADASMKILNINPININNTRYLQLNILNSGEEAGIRNSGFNGIPVVAKRKYRFSVYLRAENNFADPVVVKLESNTGSVFASDTLKNITASWKKYNLEFTSIGTGNTAFLSLTTKGTGTLCVDMVSLFPENTFKKRENGLREDLAQAIADLKPRFLRFPGGCISHGRGNDNAYRWKETIGDVAQRKPNWNLWGYHQTYGLGFFEYFQYCEDIGAKPLPVLPLGVSCQFRKREVVPMSEMGPWVQDAIDLIEFANGSATTPYGKIRAEMGHPEPFNMEYLCLGNEEDDIPEFRERFLLIAHAVKKSHPEIKIIGTSGVAASGAFYNSLWQFSRDQNLYAVDEHYYMEPSWFLDNLHRYDNFDRKGPKVFIGEYASKDDRLANAIAEAAYLTGVERNADIIQFTCYAPLLCNENNNQWHPDLIRFDNTRLAKTASYYVQQLYGIHSGDQYLNSSITYKDQFFDPAKVFYGKVGVGTWNTQASYDEVKVISGDQVLFDEGFASGSQGWNILNGSFSATGGVYTQTSNLEPALSVFDTQVNSSEYTLILKARKNGGREGFLVPFGFSDEQNYYWLNIGGWGNTQHAIERIVNGNKSVIATMGGSIENNRWYELKIENKKGNIKCYLDNQLIFNLPSAEGPVSASVVKDTKSGDLILKMVNSGQTALTVSMNMKGIETDQPISIITLNGVENQRNTLSSPETIAPKESKLNFTKEFDYTLPANSFQVFRIKSDSGLGLHDLQKEEKENKVKIVPNPMKDRSKIIFENPMGEPFTLSLFNGLGACVYFRGKLSGSTTLLERGNLSPGIYLVQIQSQSRRLFGKVLIG